MKIALNILAVVVCLLSGSSALARGDDERGNGNGNGNGNAYGHEKKSGYGAPEPITMLAVALGAGTVGLAAWRARRKRS